MSPDDRFDRELAAWMTERAAEAPSKDRLTAITDVTAQRRPRPAWLAGVGSDWVGPEAARPAWATQAMRRAVVLALLAALLMATAIGIAGLVGGQPQRTNPPPWSVDALTYAVDGDIYVASAEGGSPVRIANGRSMRACGGVQALSVAPDRRHLAYLSSWSDGCAQTLTIADPDGEVVSTIPDEGWDISWSPDSTRVVTWFATNDGSVAVYGIDGELRTLLDGSNSCCGDFDPVWSPDGAESILIRHHDADGRQIVFELPVDGATPHAVPPGDPRSLLYSADNIALGRASQPVRYSPGGTRAAFVDSLGLVLTAPDGSERRVLVAGDIDTGPVWSPAGDRIAFIDRTRTTLSVVRTVDGAVTMLANGRDMRGMDVSPDGTRVLYAQTDTAGVSSLWSANTDGSGTQLIVDGADSGAWLPSQPDAGPSPTP